MYCPNKRVVEIKLPPPPLTSAGFPSSPQHCLTSPSRVAVQARHASPGREGVCVHMVAEAISSSTQGVLRA